MCLVAHYKKERLKRNYSLVAISDESDFFTWGFRRGKQEGSDFLDNVSQCGIMGEESFFDREESFFQSGIGRKLLSETDKSVN